MYAKLVSNPPLGKCTTVTPQKDAVKFTVLLESSSERSWDVALWSNFENREKWTTSKLEPVQEPSSLITVNKDGQRTANVYQRWFSIDLKGRPAHGNTVSFTLTFRDGEGDAWKWVNEQFSTSDGKIIYQATPSKTELSDYLNGLSPTLKIEKETSDTPNTLLWSVTSSVNAASGKVSGYSNMKLGTPKDFTRWFALVRLWSPWLAPRQGRNLFNPDKEAILATFQREDGSHFVVLAVSGIDDVLTTLDHDGEGNIIMNSRNDNEKDGFAQLIITVGNSLEPAIAAGMYYARKLVMKYEVANGPTLAEDEALMKEYKPQWLENWYDGLSYCTWNGLGQKLEEKKLFAALDSLAKNNINITNLIIDDNWQSLNHEGGDQFKNAWMEFEATSVGFPRGLQAAISDIRGKHKNIKHIAVWHALIAKEYKTTKVQKKDGVSGGTMLAVAEEDVNRFYHDFYQFLSSAGVDSVKTDAQFFLDELDDATDRRQLTRAYQDAWSVNQLRFFSGKAISCMSQSPQIVFHSQLPTNKPRILLRNSDDFFPEVPASHPWHVFCNAHNAIFNQYLNVLPDWDMFQTSHQWASFHAAARCVSGGPIYITDVPGKHNVDLISQMTGNTPRGDTVILRPHTIGKSTDAYNSYDDAALLKVATYVGMARTGVSILGVFNCTQQTVSELISLDQFPGAEAGTYIIRNHTTGRITRPTSVAKANAFVHVVLPTAGWDILSAFPLHSFKLERQHEADGPAEISVANLGILGKMSGAAAIVNTDSYIDRETGRLRIWTSLKVLGTYGLYVSDLKNRCLEKDFMAVIFGRPMSLDCVRISEQDENVLEVDTVRAWRETDSHAGWSNEVAVEVIIR